MIAAVVELSRENPPLAIAELDGALAALGGRRTDPGPGFAGYGWIGVEVGSPDALRHLASRLAMVRRILRPLEEGGMESLTLAVRHAGAAGLSASFRPSVGPRAPLSDDGSRSLAAAYVAAGGHIDLARPARRFVIGETALGRRWLAEVVEASPEPPDRRMPTLPFQRPVSLSPKLGRASANLARVRPGDRVVDPFVGTGALLIEAALLGARVSGMDRDAAMVRGAIQNLAHFGVEPDELRVGDAAEAFPPDSDGGWDAVLTDPPYGRSSGTGREDPAELVPRVLQRWAEFVRPGGVIVVVLPGGPDPLPPPWVPTVRVADRVHRSLTREFCVYERAAGT